MSVVVEHGMSGAGAAAPLARETLIEVMTRFRTPLTPPGPPGQRVAEVGPPEGTR